MKISKNELLASSFQKSADQKYSNVQAEINPKKETIPPKDSAQTIR